MLQFLAVSKKSATNSKSYVFATPCIWRQNMTYFFQHSNTPILPPTPTPTTNRTLPSSSSSSCVSYTTSSWDGDGACVGGTLGLEPSPPVCREASGLQEAGSSASEPSALLLICTAKYTHNMSRRDWIPVLYWRTLSHNGCVRDMQQLFD